MFFPHEILINYHVIVHDTEKSMEIISNGFRWQVGYNVEEQVILLDDTEKKKVVTMVEGECDILTHVDGTWQHILYGNHAC